MRKSEVKKLVKNVVGFPKPGIHFKDISVILSKPRAYRAVTEDIWDHVKNDDIDMVCGLDARGFILGPMVADKLGVGFAMIRKAGKLPPPVIEQSYSLEYGEGTLAVSNDGIIKPGMRVLIFDDLLATGGTAECSIKLIEKLGATVVSVAFICELKDLKGIERFKGYKVYSYLKF